jgi:uncharacterized damage-inducible protein DinB
MPSLSPTLQDSWKANNASNDALLEHLTPEMLEAVTPGGGWTVVQHIAHMVGFYKWMSIRFAPGLQTLPDLFDPNEDDEENFTVIGDLEKIREVWPQTREAVLNAINNAKDKGSLPQLSLEHFVIHVFVHDAHHRGQIMLALKTSGFARPDDEPIWWPWRTGKV